MVFATIINLPVAWPATVVAEQQESIEIWNHNFERNWSRYDQPVRDLDADRTWIWGPEPITPGVLEPFAEAEHGQRVVQYFDKARMELNSDPTVPQSSPWYVTNGLLVRELITGQTQVGLDQFESHQPAQINIAGDPGAPLGPTYATFAGVLEASPATDGQLLTERIYRNGDVIQDQSLEQYDVHAAYAVVVPTIDHQIAEPFWSFMNQSGLVYEVGWLQEKPLFPNPFYTTGYPITEPYWSSIEVAGTKMDVLMQCFERRCLTYTPSNPPGWQVEAGNVGQHYYRWRYSTADPLPAPMSAPAPVIVLDPGHDASTGGALGIEYVDTMRTANAARAALEDSGYVVYFTRPDNGTILFGNIELMPANNSRMPHDYNEGYSHASKALEFDPDVFISLHFNGSDNPFQSGLTIYYSPAGGDQNEPFSQLVRDELTAALQEIGYEPPSADYSPDTTAGKSYGGFATLGNVYSAPQVWEENRMFGIPAVLIEPLFETNSTERGLIQDDATLAALAEALARSVDSMFKSEFMERSVTDAE